MKRPIMAFLAAALLLLPGSMSVPAKENAKMSAQKMQQTAEKMFSGTKPVSFRVTYAGKCEAEVTVEYYDENGGLWQEKCHWSCKNGQWSPKSASVQRIKKKDTDFALASCDDDRQDVFQDRQ